MVKRFLFAAVAISFLSGTATAKSPVAGEAPPIVVGGAHVQKIRLGFASFVEDGTGVNTQTLISWQNRLYGFFHFTGWFDLLQGSALSDLRSQAVVLQKPFDPILWKNSRVDDVIVGIIHNEPGKKNYSIELRLFDEKTENMIVGKMYSDVSLSNVDIVFRRFADLAVQSLTGRLGPFMSQIAFVGRKNSHSNQIYVADFDGSHSYPITHDSAIHISPSWSPDGTEVAYTSFISGQAQIYIYNLQTRRTKQLTKGEGNHSGLSWNPVVPEVVYSATGGPGQTHIFASRTDGKELVSLIHDSEIDVEPAYSSNGKFLVYTSSKYGKPMLFLWSLVDKIATRLTYAGWYNASGAWNPNDGKTIAFASYDKDIDRWDLFTILSDGSHLERLTLRQGDNEKPSWSPDGRFVMFQSNRGWVSKEDTIGNPYQIYVMDANTLETKIVDTGVADCRQPAWGPRVTKFFNP